MRHTILLSLLGLGLLGCQSIWQDYEIDTDGMRMLGGPPEERGLNYVDIGSDWRLESETLNVTRDLSKRRVLRAGAQGGAKLISLDTPRYSQVFTTAEAEAIYYDAFQDRFELVGNPVIRQGSKVTERPGDDGRLVVHRDGSILLEKVSSLVTPDS